VTIAVLLGQLSIGWQNDWTDAERDRAAGRADKPISAGEISRLMSVSRRLWLA